MFRVLPGLGVVVAEGVEAVGDLPAVFVRRLGSVVVADLHLGFEDEAASMGYFVPRVQLRRSIDILERALDETGAGWVVFAGDVKHNFSRLTPGERRELGELFSFLSRRGVRVTVVRGNHDSYLRLVARDYGVEVVDELRVGDVLVVHGHRRLGGLEGVRLVIMGHEHPSLRLRDRLGYVAKLPCFLRGRLRGADAELLVLPAVGQYQTGTTVSLSPETYLSPILKHDVDLGELRPYVLAEGLGVLEFPPLERLEDLLVEAVV